MSKISKIFTQPWRILASDKLGNMRNAVPDKLYLKCMYRSLMYRKLDLKSPKRYTEKLQWLKLYDRNPAYTNMVDKAAVKDYVASKIGNEFIIKTYGVWNSFDKINFSLLPDRFVIKCTHDSAGLVICKDKNSFDFEKSRDKIQKALSRNFFYSGREWPYKNVKPRIIVEEYMEDTELHELRDYKFFTFGGVPKIMHLVSNRQNEEEETYGDFYDMNFKHIDLTMGHNNAPYVIEKPKNFELMKKLACVLSEGIPHVRVDFYEVNGRVYFGELTFYQDSGFSDIKPDEWDFELGKWIDLP